MMIALPPASTSSSASPDQLIRHALQHVLLGQVFHRLQALAGAVSGRGRAVDFRRAEQVEVIDHLRSRGLFQRDDIAERHQSVGVRAHVVLPQVARVHAERLIGLHVNAIGTIVEVEVVDVLRTHVDAQRLRHLADGHSDGLGLFAIDLHQLLRIVGGKAGEQSLQVLALAAGGDDLVRNRVEVLQRIAAQVLQLELESAEAADALNRRRFEGHHDRSRNAEQLGRDARHDVAGRVSFAFAVVDRLQRREDQSVVRRTAAGQREAGNREGAEDIRIGPQNLSPLAARHWWCRKARLPAAPAPRR